MVKNADVDSVKAAVAGGVGHVKGSLDAALALWGSYDKDGVSCASSLPAWAALARVCVCRCHSCRVLGGGPLPAVSCDHVRRLCRLRHAFAAPRQPHTHQQRPQHTTTSQHNNNNHDTNNTTHNITQHHHDIATPHTT